jgi:hypothetical protein
MADNDEPVYSVLNGKGNGTWGQGGPPAGTTAWSCSAGWAMASWNCPYDWSLGPFPSPEPSIDCTYELEVAHVGEYYFIPCYQS